MTQDHNDPDAKAIAAIGDAKLLARPLAELIQQFHTLPPRPSEHDRRAQLRLYKAAHSARSPFRMIIQMVCEYLEIGDAVYDPVADRLTPTRWRVLHGLYLENDLTCWDQHDRIFSQATAQEQADLAPLRRKAERHAEALADYLETHTAGEPPAGYVRPGETPPKKGRRTSKRKA
jgi:hypothetical protein